MVSDKQSTLRFGPMNGLPVPVVKAMYGKKPKVNTGKAASSLGLVSYINPDQTYEDMAVAMLNLGLGRDWVPSPLLKLMVVVLGLMLAVGVGAALWLRV